MNQNQVNGVAAYVFGSIQMTTGKLVGNRSLELHGLGRRVAGSSQKARGDAQQLIKRCIKRQCVSS